MLEVVSASLNAVLKVFASKMGFSMEKSSIKREVAPALVVLFMSPLSRRMLSREFDAENCKVLTEIEV